MACGNAPRDEISNRKMSKNRIVELDTGVTLCCSVRQQRHEFKLSSLAVDLSQAEKARMKSATVTIRDVAKDSGFSSTTVSIVLNNAPLARYIPAVTKKRIEQAAKKLGYRPNLFARSLRSKRSHTVGVMVFDMTDPFCTLVLRGHREYSVSILLSSHSHRCAQRAQPFRALPGNVTGPAGRGAHRGGQLAVRGYRRSCRSGKEQYSHRDDWTRTANRLRQLRNCR